MPIPHPRAALITALAAFSAILAPSVGAQTASAPAPPASILVRGVDAAVEVTTSPLRLAVIDAAGRPVLASVADDPPALPTVQSPLPPEIIGYDLPLQDPPTYAPLTYVVGVDRPLQQPAGTWVTNILLSASGGIEHALTDVTAVQARPDGGVDLEVATTEVGRVARVVVAPDADGLVSVDVSFGDPSGVATVAASFATDTDEAFHGFGGRRDETDQRGSSFVNWHEEFNLRPEATENEVLETLGPRYQFPSGPEAAYYAVGAFVSSRPYAFWLETTNPSRWRLASDRDDAWQVAAASDSLRMVVAPGDAPTAVANLTEVTGRHPLPPEWALGPMVSRAVQAGGQDSAYAADVDADLATIEALRPPLTAYAFEGWPWLEQVEALEATIDRVDALDLRSIGYVRAFAAADEGGTERRSVFQEALTGGFFATTPDGTSPYLFGSALGPGPAGLVDAADEAAAAWWRARITDHLDAGFDGFMQDFGEQGFVDMVFADGRTGLEVHNDNPRLIHGLTREAVDAYVRDHPDREPFFFVRTGTLGRPGSPAMESASWPGDNSADWSRASGIGSVIPDMLNRGLTGSYGFVSEIGGFIDVAGPIDDELFTRWSQQAALMPVHRLHGHPINGTQMPWDFGDDAYTAWLGTAELHQRAQPLIRQLWAEAAATGAPIARPLWWHHPDEPEARQAEQSWLLGPDVLVAPVVEEGATEREVWFPPGCWEHGDPDPTDGDQRIEGPLTRTVAAPLEVLPWYVRCGTDPLGDATVRRLAGDDRIATAVAVAGVMPGWSGDRVVLARADDFPDALAGAPLAARERAPMLLTDRGRLSRQVEDLIIARGVERAVLLGGEAALGPDVEARLIALGVEVDRVAGPDRIATAVAIAERVVGDRPASQAYLATVAGAADALSAAPLAAFQGAPVLLTGGDRLDPRVAAFLQQQAIGTVTLIGGQAALAPAVEEGAAGTGARVQRIAAADRYETSIAVAEAAIAAGMASERPWIARGDDPADALAAGPVIAADAATLVLTAPDRLPDVVRDHLVQVLGPHPQIHVLGGAAAIGEAVEAALDALAAGR